MDISNLFKALSDDTRLRLMTLLFENELSVTELEQIIETSQSNISRHLAKLLSQGLVKTRRSKHHVYYRINSDALVSWPFLSSLLIQLKNRLEGAADLERLAHSQLPSTKRSYTLSVAYSDDDLI